MNARTDLGSPFTDPDDLDNNRSANPHFQDVLRKPGQLDSIHLRTNLRASSLASPPASIAMPF